MNCNRDCLNCNVAHCAERTEKIIKRVKMLEVDEFKREEHAFKIDNYPSSIRLNLDYAPSWEDLKSFVPKYLMATWIKSYDSNYVEFLKSKMVKFYENNPELGIKTEDILELTKSEIDDCMIYRALRGYFIPSIFETVRLNVTLSGISSHDVTHLLRYRGMTFFADCTGDKILKDRAVLLPESIKNGNKDILSRYLEISEKSMGLYYDMIEDKENYTLHDARLNLPRMTETFYHVSMNLRDAINFINQRIDTQIQPISDNAIAIRLAEALLSKYPILAKILKVDNPNGYYIKESQTNFKSGFYKPRTQNDVFSWSDSDFNYTNPREHYEKSNVYELMIEEFENIKSECLNNCDSEFNHLEKYNDFFR